MVYIPYIKFNMQTVMKIPSVFSLGVFVTIILYQVIMIIAGAWKDICNCGAVLVRRRILNILQITDVVKFDHDNGGNNKRCWQMSDNNFV